MQIACYSAKSLRITTCTGHILRTSTESIQSARTGADSKACNTAQKSTRNTYEKIPFTSRKNANSHFEVCETKGKYGEPWQPGKQSKLFLSKDNDKLATNKPTSHTETDKKKYKKSERKLSHFRAVGRRRVDADRPINQKSSTAI